MKRIQRILYKKRRTLRYAAECGALGRQLLAVHVNDESSSQMQILEKKVEIARRVIVEKRL
ncbi:hypothetical protein RvY_11059 [Ramazzottius varieornatus]|uniref:Uncharacterized protein n=1 Tax=Ramazzottius varieornatus TaxID=947166 RepID=A0A1D1VEW9_RAMVA|nr:hypothetical protein RvY_11059 [Ramazzottius varieornatus]